MARAKKTDPLEDLLDAWDKAKGGRDDARARELADEYVKANPVPFEEFAEWSLEECVAAVDVLRQAAINFRAKGLERQAVKADVDKLLVDVWLLHRFEPQHIGGMAEAKVRVPNG